MATTDLRLPEPYIEDPNEAVEVCQAEGAAWEAAIRAFVANIVISKLSPETTPTQLFTLFNEPQHQPILFYCACAQLLAVMRELRVAEEHIALIAALFGLLKKEGLARDTNPDEDCPEDVPVPPGYEDHHGMLVQHPEYEGSLSGRSSQNTRASTRGCCAYDADDCLLDPGRPGEWLLVFYQGQELLRALENPINCGVWETLWAALLRCDRGLVYGWGSGDLERLDSFKDAARKIAGDERAPLHWRARFAP
ncbi:hypothetical protein DFH08DRAFT_813129 [Mycena albidolilacea]|uniref:Uncharacterized protein n=1 Tax=Mycena albidolilacea TaxID=1033008 RepID=A0AAD6ZS47_9AGAR|nr:hypothetical protein DFH08DRAFT_813129 [Mycena albidolilacea]